MAWKTQSKFNEIMKILGRHTRFNYKVTYASKQDQIVVRIYGKSGKAGASYEILDLRDINNTSETEWLGLMREFRSDLKEFSKDLE